MRLMSVMSGPAISTIFSMASALGIWRALAIAETSFTPRMSFIISTRLPMWEKIVCGTS